MPTPVTSDHPAIVVRAPSGASTRTVPVAADGYRIPAPTFRSRPSRSSPTFFARTSTRVVPDGETSTPVDTFGSALAATFPLRCRSSTASRLSSFRSAPDIDFFNPCNAPICAYARSVASSGPFAPAPGAHTPTTSTPAATPVTTRRSPFPLTPKTAPH